MKPKKVRKIVWIIFGSGVLLGLIGILAEITPLAAVGMAVMLCSSAVHFIFYRCPHCGGFLDRSTGDYCPHCGENVNR